MVALLRPVRPRPRWSSSTSATPVGLVELDHGVEPVPPYKRSLDYRFTFPPQEFEARRRATSSIRRPGATNVVSVDGRPRRPAPRQEEAGAGAGRRSSEAARSTRRRCARRSWSSPRRSSPATGGFAADRALLRREPPRLWQGRLSAGVDDAGRRRRSASTAQSSPSRARRAPARPIRGARMVVAALRAGQRVAITAQSHAAIQNLLRAIEDARGEATGSRSPASTRAHGLRQPPRVHRRARRTTATPTATSSSSPAPPWLFARDEHREALRPALHRRGGPVLARQRGRGRGRRADEPRPARRSAAAPAGHAGRAPRRLGRVGARAPARRRSDHPARPRRPPDRELAHAPRRLRVRLRAQLRRAPALARRLCERGASTQRRRARRAPVCGRSRSSTRDAARPRPRRPRRSPPPAATLLAGGDGHRRRGRRRATLARRRHPRRRALQPRRRAASASACRDGVRVGTVDRFQGQEAPVVFFAMTCSSGEDVPRGLDFLFDATA